MTDASHTLDLGRSPEAASDPDKVEVLSPSPQATERVSLRWETARRAVRDGDLTTITFLVDQAGIFTSPSSLRSACISGAWGTWQLRIAHRAVFHHRFHPAA